MIHRLSALAMVALASVLVAMEPLDAQCVPRPPEIVSWWRGEGDAFDNQGVNPGTLFGGMGFTSALVGDGFLFDGSNDRVAVAHHATLDFSDALTVEAWVQTDDPTRSQAIVCKSRCSTNQPGFILYLLEDSGQVHLAAVLAGAPGCNVVGRITAVDAYPSDGDFHHVALTYLGGSSPNASLFVDGVEVAAVATDLPAALNHNTQPLLIGALQNLAGAYTTHFVGVIDEPAVYSRALFPDEVLAIADALGAGKCPEDDGTAPLVSFGYPTDGMRVADTGVNVDLVVADDSQTSVQFSPGGAAATAPIPPGGGSVSDFLPLEQEGDNLLTALVTDTFGNSAVASVTVVRDLTPPSVTVVSPPSGSIVASPALSLSISVADDGLSTVEVGGVIYSVPAPGGALTATVQLAEGLNSIPVVATDDLGNTVTVSHMIVLDGSAPIVRIDSPTAGEWFGPGSQSLPVVATVDDDSATTVTSTPAGLTASLPGGGGIATGTVDLVEGANTITVDATDSTGQVAGDSVTVQFDGTAPTVHFLTPLSGDVGRGDLEVQVDAFDAGIGVARVDFYVDGALFESSSARPFGFVLDTRTLADGLHTLEAVGSDRLDNSTSVSVTVDVDNTAPVIVIRDPEEGAAVQGVFAFVAEIEDDGLGITEVEVLVGGQSLASAPGLAFEGAASSTMVETTVDSDLFSAGPLVLSVTATDAAGNRTTVERTVVVQSATPVVTGIQTPRAGETVRGMVPVVVDSNDSSVVSVEVFADGQRLGRVEHFPAELSFDSMGRLDGAVVLEVVASHSGGETERTGFEVVVDNFEVNLSPNPLDLESTLDDGARRCASHKVHRARLVYLAARCHYSKVRDQKRRGKCEHRHWARVLERARRELVKARRAYDRARDRLEKKSHRSTMVARITGGAADRLTESGPLFLVVPGVGAVPAAGAPRSDGEGGLLVEFDRKQVVSRVRAGIRSGLFESDSDLELAVRPAGGGDVGSDLVHIQGK